MGSDWAFMYEAQRRAQISWFPRGRQQRDALLALCVPGYLRKTFRTSTGKKRVAYVPTRPELGTGRR